MRSVVSSSHDPAPRMADDDRKRKSGNLGGEPEGPGTAVITKTKSQTKRPNLYRVLILNDDYTPMEFVVAILQEYFNKDREAATQIMLKVQRDGKGMCGVYPKDIASTKVELVLTHARKAGHPLQCMMEEA